MFSVFKKLQKAKRPFCSAIIVAAGASQRIGQDKLMVRLGGMPVLAMTLTAFQNSDCINEIVVVTASEKIPEVARVCRDYGITKATRVVCGGQTRAHSALAGLSECSPRAKLAAIHDAARPLVTREIIEGACHAALLYGAAAPAVPVKDTVKIAEDGVVLSTTDRSRTMAVQTPQIFTAELIKGALTYVIQNDIPVTDDCSAAEAMGISVRLTPGSEENVKITTPVDFEVASAILNSRSQ